MPKNGSYGLQLLEHTKPPPAWGQMDSHTHFTPPEGGLGLHFQHVWESVSPAQAPPRSQPRSSIGPRNQTL